MEHVDPRIVEHRLNENSEGERKFVVTPVHLPRRPSRRNGRVREARLSRDACRRRDRPRVSRQATSTACRTSRRTRQARRSWPRSRPGPNNSPSLCMAPTRSFARIDISLIVVTSPSAGKRLTRRVAVEPAAVVRGTAGCVASDRRGDESRGAAVRGSVCRRVRCLRSRVSVSAARGALRDAGRPLLPARTRRAGRVRSLNISREQSRGSDDLSAKGVNVSVSLASACALLSVSLEPAVSGCAAAEPPIDTVSTLAGTGKPGFADGTAQHGHLPDAVGDGRPTHPVTSTSRMRRPSASGRSSRAPRSAPSPAAANQSPTARTSFRVRVTAQGRNARFFTPSGIVAAPDGTLYVADTNNGAIRRIAPRRRYDVRPQPRASATDRARPRRKPICRRLKAWRIAHIAERHRHSPEQWIAIVTLRRRHLRRTRCSESVFVADARGISGSRLDGSDRVRYLNAANAVTEGTPGRRERDYRNTFSTGRPQRSRRRLYGRTSALRSLPRPHCTTSRSSSPAAATKARTWMRADLPTARHRRRASMLQWESRCLPNGSLVVADAGNRRIREISGFDHREITRDPLSVIDQHRDPASIGSFTSARRTSGGPRAGRSRFPASWSGPSPTTSAPGWDARPESSRFRCWARLLPAFRVVHLERRERGRRRRRRLGAQRRFRHPSAIPSWKAAATSTLRNLRATLVSAHIPFVDRRRTARR